MDEQSCKTVCVLGLGYIGLPTSAVLANYGFVVTGVDINPKVVVGLNEGELHFSEPELKALVHEALRCGSFKASSEVQKSDTYLIAVPTPITQSKEADLKYVFQAVDMIVPYLGMGDLVILESTVSVGTTEAVRDRVLAKRRGLEGQVFFAYCPERVLPGQILYELINNDRVVGGVDEHSTKKASAFYRTFVKGTILETNSRTAEFCKLSENAYRDVNIAFANELSMISAQHGVDAWEVIQLANRHPRVQILQPGCGVGGHCIAVDPWFLYQAAPEIATLTKESRLVNTRKTQWVSEQILKEVQQWKADNGREPRVVSLGLTFKADVDDVRDSPAMQITQKIAHSIPDLMIVDPHVQSIDKLGLVEMTEALEKADIVIFLVKHREFLEWNLNGLKVLDYCNATKV